MPRCLSGSGRSDFAVSSQELTSQRELASAGEHHQPRGADMITEVDDLPQSVHG